MAIKVEYEDRTLSPKELPQSVYGYTFIDSSVCILWTKKTKKTWGGIDLRTNTWIETTTHELSENFRSAWIEVFKTPCFTSGTPIISPAAMENGSVAVTAGNDVLVKCFDGLWRRTRDGKRFLAKEVRELKTEKIAEVVQR